MSRLQGLLLFKPPHNLLWLGNIPLWWLRVDHTAFHLLMDALIHFTHTLTSNADVDVVVSVEETEASEARSEADDCSHQDIGSSTLASYTKPVCS